MNNDETNRALRSLKGQMPDKPKVDATVREKKIAGESEENRMLRTVGERLTPDTFQHVGSIGIHIYKQGRTGLNVAIAVQNCLDEPVTAIEANYALQKASIDIARSYGWEPSKKQKSVIKEL